MKTIEILIGLAVLVGSANPGWAIKHSELLNGCEKFGHTYNYTAAEFLKAYGRRAALDCMRKRFPGLQTLELERGPQGKSFVEGGAYEGATVAAVGRFTQSEESQIRGVYSQCWIEPVLSVLQLKWRALKDLVTRKGRQEYMALCSAENIGVSESGVICRTGQTVTDRVVIIAKEDLKGESFSLLDIPTSVLVYHDEGIQKAKALSDLRELELVVLEDDLLAAIQQAVRTQKLSQEREAIHKLKEQIGMKDSSVFDGN